ncbi:glutathione S-transferase family protein [Alkalilacustris brevis]|uniref:glutathione S-transferase family protein n=1 Tax=Alkalilacustris brevis TaxID=2026338 RepID=UPI00138FA204|nr:glutathione S-transferase N-terminal domain-containing protein [Alkalilacustris brevis]
MTLQLWGRASSVNVQKVLWALDELGLQYERHDAGGKYGVVDTDEFVRLNPNRRVPVLQDGALTLWESQAILRYLALREGRLLPDGLADRAHCDQWLAFTDTTLMPPFIGAFWQMVRMSEAARNTEKLAGHRRAFQAALRIMDGQLRNGPWLGGATFSIADIAAGTPMFRAADLGLVPQGLSHLGHWHERLRAREGFRRHVATSYDELKAG